MSLEARISGLETRLAAVEAASRRTGTLVLIEGKDGTRDEIRRRAAEELAVRGKSPLVVLHTNPRLRPDELPAGAVGFDLQDIGL